MALPIVRRQLSLYASGGDTAVIERLRERLDPVQFALIPAHVTLCREEDLADVDEVGLDQRLRGARRLALRFGAAQSFSTHGILLPCIEGEAEFQALRACALGRLVTRTQSPHITLAHPRNPKAPDNRPEVAASLGAGRRCEFNRVNLIEQIAGGPWRTLRSWSLPS